MVYCYMCGRDHDPNVGCFPANQKKFVKSTSQLTFLERIGLNMTKKELWNILISSFIGVLIGYALFHPISTTSGGIVESKIPIKKTLDRTNELLDGMGKTLESIKKDQDLLHEQQKELSDNQNSLKKEVDDQDEQLKIHERRLNDQNEDIKDLKDKTKTMESDISQRVYELEKEAKSHKWNVDPKEPTVEASKDMNTVQEKK